MSNIKDMSGIDAQKTVSDDRIAITVSGTDTSILMVLGLGFTLVYSRDESALRLVESLKGSIMPPFAFSKWEAIDVSDLALPKMRLIGTKPKPVNPRVTEIIDNYLQKRGILLVYDELTAKVLVNGQQSTDSFMRLLVLLYRGAFTNNILLLDAKQYSTDQIRLLSKLAGYYQMLLYCYNNDIPARLTTDFKELVRLYGGDMCGEITEDRLWGCFRTEFNGREIYVRNMLNAYTGLQPEYREMPIAERLLEPLKDSTQRRVAIPVAKPLAPEKVTPIPYVRI